MKKIIFALMLSLLFTFTACRPAEEVPSGSTGTGESGQTEEPVTDEGGTPVEDETGTYVESETHACTYTEDPALRAEAEAIDSREFTIEYYDFCKKHDIKAYLPVPGTFAPQTLQVTLRKACSIPERTTPDFSCVQATNIINITKDAGNLRYEINVPATNREEILAVIDTLMELDCVLLVEVIPMNFSS